MYVLDDCRHESFSLSKMGVNSYRSTYLLLGEENQVTRQRWAEDEDAFAHLRTGQHTQLKYIFLLERAFSLTIWKVSVD